MMKKLLCVALVLLMILPIFAACQDDGGNGGADVAPPAENGNDDVVVPAGDWKIGIVTGTVSQGEEEFMAGQKMLERHGADRIMHVTYPDRAADEIETTIAQVMSLVDAGVDAIIFNQAVIGSLPALQRARQANPDLLIIAGTIAEPTRALAQYTDIILQSDDVGRGVTIMEQAHAQGATTFVHYSFPRHLAIDMINRRYILLQETADRLGIDFVNVMAPDPMGDAGVPGAQQFIIEDVPRQVAEFGPDTAFFSTNCAMQEPLIRQVMAYGAIYPEPCCPSPFHAMPAAFNIQYEPGEADLAWMIDQISAVVAAEGMAGRISNWSVPLNMLNIEAGVKYAIMFLEGETNGRLDRAALDRAMQYVLDEYGASIQSMQPFEDEEGVLENVFMILGDFANFGT